MGDVSKNGWESMNAHYEEMEKLDRTKVEDLDTEYETWLGSQKGQISEEISKQLTEDQANWDIFLDSF